MRKVLLVLILTVLLWPTVFMVKSGFESAVGLLRMPPSLIPQGVTLQHYGRLLRVAWFGRWLVNSMVLLASTIALTIVITLMAGFSFQSKWRGQKLVMGIFLLSAALPMMVLIIPRYMLMRLAGLSGGFVVALIPMTYMPTGILICRAWMLQIGPTHCEEARLEGASEWQVLWYVAAPMTMPVIALMILGQGMAVLGDFLWQSMTLPYVYQQTMLIGLTTAATNWLGPGQPDPLGPQMATGTILIAPILVVFIVGQRFFRDEGKGMTL